MTRKQTEMYHSGDTRQWHPMQLKLYAAARKLAAATAGPVVIYTGDDDPVPYDVIYARRLYMHIEITSGEGELGTTVVYRGVGSDRALRSRLTRERCNSDRWARVVIYSHTSHLGEEIGYDFETGEARVMTVCGARAT